MVKAIFEFFRNSGPLSLLANAAKACVPERGVLGARSVNQTKAPKVLSHGSKPFVLFGAGEPIVIVEDVVSAIKVSRVATALPLFGSNFPSDWMVRLAKLKPSSVVIWLDMDKAKDSRDYAYKFNALLPVARPVATEQDPKCFEEGEIRRILGIDNA
jgi:hypothetical protein